MEVKDIVDQAFNRARRLIMDNREKLDLLAQRLIEKEVIDIDEARRLLGMAIEKKAQAEPSAHAGSNPVVSKETPLSLSGGSEPADTKNTGTASGAESGNPVAA
jgi:cell division protease FtsH